MHSDVRILLVSVALIAVAPLSAAAGIVIDSPMMSDPALKVPGSVERLAPKYKPLWFAALQGPEEELRMRAAEAIALARVERLDPLTDAIPHLVRALREPDQSLPARISLARALIVLEARDAAELLFEQTGDGELEMIRLVEPALGDWEFEPIRRVWVDRLNSERDSGQALVVAVRGLGTLGESDARATLRQTAVSSQRPSTLRLEAARALARIQSEGLEAGARNLLSNDGTGGLVDRLVAASLLARHSSPESIALLEQLAVDSEPAVAAVALKRLLEIDPALARPLADRSIESADATVRHLGAEALVKVPSPAAVALLGGLLDDPHPDVRSDVRDSLFELAQQDELDGPVREAAMRMLSTDGWRGLEQAAMLLGALDHEPAADRLLALLEFPRPEVMVSSAWALRKLAIAETLAPVLESALRQTKRLKGPGSKQGIPEQIAQFFQFFGQQRYAPADELMRRYVPKDFSLGDPPRGAAVWALGHLHAGRPDEQLTEQLQERLQDYLETPLVRPESTLVRRMSAVTLGRMRSKNALPALREMLSIESLGTEVGAACGWAITELTGEQFTTPEDTTTFRSGWFLEPVE